MGRFFYTQEHLQFLRKNYKYMMCKDLTEAFNNYFQLKKKPGQIRAALQNHKIKAGRGSLFRPKMLLTDEQSEFVSKTYKKYDRNKTTEKLNDKFGTKFTVQQIATFIQNRGFKSGRSGQFPIGHIPWTAGRKGICFSNSGQFPKGNKPKNLRHFNSERKTKDGYTILKIKEVNPHTGYIGLWVLKHRYLWEQENGKIPDGMKLIFKDGDRSNMAIDNFELVSNTELAALNQRKYKQTPAALKPVVLTAAKLTAKVWECKQKISKAER